MALSASQSSKTYTGFLFFGLVMSLILAILFLMPIEPNDYWWYARVGRDIANTGTIPMVEHLSYTQEGAPVTYHVWLAALSFWGANQAGGVLLTGLLRGFLVGGFYLFLWLAVREIGAGPKLAALVLLTGALTGSNNWAMRPQMFAYPLFGLSLWIITGWQNGKYRRLWLLPVLSALWANVHGSFPLLFVLLGAVLIAGSADRSRLLLMTGLALIATLINPFGPHVWVHALSLMRNPTIIQFATEWQPPVNQGWQMNMFFGWLLAFAPLAALSPKKPTVMEWLWFIGLGWMALLGLRYGIWFTAVLVLISSRMLAEWIGSRIDRPGSFNQPQINLAIGAMVLLLPLALLPGLRQQWWAQAPSNFSRTTPVEAVAWLAAQPDLPGQLWSDLIFSSYVTYALPERPVWIHTQFEIYPPEHVSRYLEISNASPDWDTLLKEDGINLLLLSRAEQAALVLAAENDNNWEEVYQDDIAVIFVRQQR